MTYEEAQAYIREKNLLGSVLGLDNIKELLKRLGEPQNKVKVVHIAGTNGKGSILACIDAVLRDAGYKVGRYISPTIFCYLERFQVNGKYMEETAFAEYLTAVATVVEGMKAEGYVVTAFEIETALAFLYFYEIGVDMVLLETGMGGRLDATNVVDKPVCTILASISMDHMNILGNTVEQITYEKCGILREGVPCVSYPQTDRVRKVIEEFCGLHNVGLILPECKELTMEKSDLEHEIFDYKKVKYELGLLGEYQIYNAITAIEALDVINSYLKATENIALKKVNMQRGLHNVKWEGRFEILCRNPYVIRDGAHNLDAAIQLRNQLIKHFTNKRIIYIIGVLGDKEHQKMLSVLGPLAQKAYAITVPDNTRALPAECLAEELKSYIEDVVIAHSPEEALDAAVKEADASDVIVAFGSLYYIGKIGA